MACPPGAKNNSGCTSSNDGRHGADNKLDLYRPTTSNWPLIVFVHGGGWDSGDKDFRAGGADVYANVGRYYAARGIGVAVINYRLQPRVTWREQVEDVRTAVSWLRARAVGDGGQPEQIFLMGHSAGTHLALLVALSATAEMRRAIRDVIAVSGAGLDLTDEKTYQLGADRDYYVARFRDGDSSDEWKRRASPVPGESHTRIVLALSHPDKVPARAILEFVR